MSVSSHNNLGGPKKRGRKPKKVIEKELLQEYNSETPNLKDQKNMYENMQYLSQREKDLFEQKFARPKTKSQEIYASTLRSKAKKIIIATGPAGTGKTMFAKNLAQH